MKKLLLTLCIAALLPLGAHAESFLDRSRSAFISKADRAQWTTYDNRYCGYSLQLPTGYESYSDQELADSLERNQADGEDEDQLYDIRIWMDRNSSTMLMIQMKECTYGSFEEECAKAPYYAEYMKEEWESDETMLSPRMYHEGILRDTPLGMMLETCYQYDYQVNEELQVTITVMYYDFYYNDIEYIFLMESGSMDYAALQALLHDIVSTVKVDKVV